MPATASRAETRAGTRAESSSEQLASLVRDPVRFSRGLLKHDPWTAQERILRSVATSRRTAVKACHASGKTHIASDVVQWWVARYEDGIVVTTAPTWTQVEKQLWGEIHKSAENSRVAFPKLNATELKVSAGNYAIGLSTDKGVRFQGWHGRILILLDEAPGVLPEIYEAIEGIRAGGDVRVLGQGNPIIASGPFYDAFHAQRATWSTITISAFDTPNMTGIYLDNGKAGAEHYHIGLGTRNLLELTEDELDENPRPYLVTKQWVKEKFLEWGPVHPLWESKVLGQFPTQSEDALIALAWIERAAATISGHDQDPLEAGVDVAGPGEDETVAVVRQGPNRLAMRHWSSKDARGDVTAFLRPFKPRLRKVKVDSIGQGYYFARHLEDDGFPVVDVNVQQTERVDTERFANLKAQLYWSLRERAQTGALGGITDGTEQAQLAAIHFGHDSRGRVTIESKDDMRKRGVKSPDRAEADMLAFGEIPEPPQLKPPPRSFSLRTYK